MANNTAVFQQCKQNSVMTASPGQLTLQLYNGLVKFIKLAILGVENNSVQEVNVNLLRAQDIIRELLCTLKIDYEVAKNMAAMYEYMLERLIHANIHKDKEVMEEVLGYAEQFRDTWAEAMKSLK